LTCGHHRGTGQDPTINRDRAVIVPPSWPGDRNDYAIEAVLRHSTRFRIMGKIPMQDPKGA
jgi:hypothetical protein